MLSPDMAKHSSQKIVQKINHRWRSPLYSKEDMTRPVVEVGGGTLLFLSAHCFSSFCLNLVGVPMSQHPLNHVRTSESRPGSHDF